MDYKVEPIIHKCVTNLVRNAFTRMRNAFTRILAGKSRTLNKERQCVGVLSKLTILDFFKVICCFIGNYKKRKYIWRKMFLTEQN